MQRLFPTSLTTSVVSKVGTNTTNNPKSGLIRVNSHCGDGKDNKNENKYYYYWF